MEVDIGSSVTVLITAAIDSLDRLENLTCVMRYLDHLGLNQRILVEFSERPQLCGLFDARYVYCQRLPGEPWCKSRALNAGLEWVTTPTVMMHDTDMLVPAPQLQAAVGGALTIYDTVAPYNRCYYVKRSVIQTVPSVDFEAEIQSPLTSFAMALGGCAVFNTTTLRHLRGFNRLFWGWGYEDDELSNRCHKLGLKMGCVPGPMLHIDHSRGPDGMDDGRAMDKRCERQRMAEWSAEEVRAYYGISEAVGRYSQLNKPDEPDQRILDAVAAQVTENYTLPS